jgi:hypothetical protein
MMAIRGPFLFAKFEFGTWYVTPSWKAWITRSCSKTKDSWRYESMQSVDNVPEMIIIFKLISALHFRSCLFKWCPTGDGERLVSDIVSYIAWCDVVEGFLFLCTIARGGNLTKFGNCCHWVLLIVCNLIWWLGKGIWLDSGVRKKGVKKGVICQDLQRKFFELHIAG